MDPERYQKLMDCFDAVCDQPADEQGAAVAALRASHPELAERLGKLLAEDARGTGSLAAAAGAKLLARELARPEIGGPAAVDVAEVGREGSRVGSWRVCERLGRGGVGTVYRVEHVDTGAVAAIKFLRSSVGADGEAVRRLEREFRAVSRLDHRGCLKVIEEGQGASGHYFVMEYAAGGDLRRLVGASTPVLLRLIHEVAEALAYVHAQGIVHRDLKPANVLLSDDEPPQPKLADFGIAKVIDASAALTVAGTLVGSIDYLAPEQIRGKPADARSDLYALGCTMHTLWTGRVPFEGDNFERLQARLRGRPPPLDNPDLPPALITLHQRLLSPEPSERPQSATDVAAVLGALCAPRERLESKVIRR